MLRAMRERIELRFYAELNDFLPPAQRAVPFEVEIDGSPAIKDVIEARGVPHTEVDMILIDGHPVGFDHRVAAGARVSVYPVFESFDVGGLSPLRERPLRDPKFFADVGLRKLARDLRLLGFDTLWSSTATDPEIIDTSLREHRIILTRDLGILKSARVTHGLFVRSTDPRTQIEELLARLQLASLAKPFTICLACNGRIEPFGDDHRCASCARVYWKGSHYDALVTRLRKWLPNAENTL